MNDLSGDLLAGLTLAAVAIPEQMATARLGGFAPEIGFLAFIAGSLGFAIFGNSRQLSAGADSTITPIFAGGLAILAVAGSPAYAGLAAALALLVGTFLVLGGIFRLGWIANLLSVPMTTGFLAGIAVHIIVSQLPALLGVPAGGDDILARLSSLAAGLGRTNVYALALGSGVFAVTFLSEKISPRIPGALAGMVLATLSVIVFHLEDRGVPVLGPILPHLPHLGLPTVAPGQLVALVGLALIISIVVMVQTATTTRAFSANGNSDVNRDFIGIGAGSVLAGLTGAFPVNASPPRTAVASQSGGRSQLTGLVAATFVGLLAVLGPSLLTHVPAAALAGLLLFVAQRITRFAVFVRNWRQSKAEFALAMATIIAIVFLPIQIGVTAGVILSVLQGVWTTTRTGTIELERIPGTSVWWPQQDGAVGEKLDGVMVLAFQAPLSFLNAYGFRSGFLKAMARAPHPLRLVVLEASAIVEIDYTAAQILAEIFGRCRQENIIFAIARLESVRGQQALERFGITGLLGQGRLFRTVQEAVDAFLSAPHA